ncbi:MAG: nuclear transport factor 2 family protein [Proteobacteria bacterium]|nr:nuclear transport factor 2 family protein [Pseudomonadota bacterium]
MIRFLFATTFLLFAASQISFAGPLEEAQAQAHRSAIAAGDLDAIMHDYAEDAYMDWVGGPLDGRYQGKSAIRAVWQKFIAANAGQPRPAKFGKLDAYANPKGTSVSWAAEYAGTTPVKAWHMVVYREGSLASEIWQIAPALQVKQ